MVMMAGNGNADGVEFRKPARTCWLVDAEGSPGPGLVPAANMDGSPPSSNPQITSGYLYVGM